MLILLVLQPLQKAILNNTAAYINQTKFSTSYVYFDPVLVLPSDSQLVIKHVLELCGFEEQTKQKIVDNLILFPNPKGYCFADQNDIKIASIANYNMKALDRLVVVIVIYIEILILSFICSIFLETTYMIQSISESTFKKAKHFLKILLIIIGIIFFLLSLCVFVFGAVLSANIFKDFFKDLKLSSIILLVLFICGGIIFFFSSLTISIVLNIIGKKLNASLIQQQKSQDITHATYEIKKSALQKTLLMQIGLTISIMFQCLGFLFIPITYIWNYGMVLFYLTYNIGILVFTVLLLGIYNPLRKVQKMFKDNNSSVIAMNRRMQMMELRNESVNSEYYLYGNDNGMDNDLIDNDNGGNRGMNNTLDYYVNDNVNVGDNEKSGGYYTTTTTGNGNNKNGDRKSSGGGYSRFRMDSDEENEERIRNRF
ncbi:hypothetical protein ABK040_011308 [Willaertia magna]